MSKTIAFFVSIFILGTVFSGIAAGAGGMLATNITAPMTATDNVITVGSTANYLTTDILYIGTEKILYTGKTATQFTGCTRGYDGSVAAAYAVGKQIRNGESNIINEALGVNISAVASNSGWASVITVPLAFFTNTLPNIMQMNFPFLQGDMAIFGYIFLACSIGLLISLAFSMLWVAAGIIKLI